MDNKIVLIKLITGEELVGKLISGVVGEGASLVLRDPFHIMFKITDAGINADMIPYFLSSIDPSIIERDVTIKSVSIGTYIESGAPPELCKEYLKKTTSIELL